MLVARAKMSQISSLAELLKGIEKGLLGNRGLLRVIPDQQPHHHVGIKRRPWGGFGTDRPVRI